MNEKTISDLLASALLGEYDKKHALALYISTLADKKEAQRIRVKACIPSAMLQRLERINHKLLQP